LTLLLGECLLHVSTTASSRCRFAPCIRWSSNCDFSMSLLLLLLLLLLLFAAADSRPSKNILASHRANQHKATNADAAPSAAAAAAAAQAESQQDPQATLPQAWWFSSGFDATELLQKNQPRPTSPEAAAVAGVEQRRRSRTSRRTTRDAGGAGRRSPAGLPGGVSASKRQSSSSSRPASAHMQQGARLSSTSEVSARDSLHSAGASPASGEQQQSPSRRSTRSRAGPGSTAAGFRRASLHEGSGLGGHGVTHEQLLARLLAASSAQAVSATFARLGAKAGVAVLQLLAGKDKGAAAVAALLQSLPPVVAAR
jgi:hypothetical protein